MRETADSGAARADALRPSPQPSPAGGRGGQLAVYVHWPFCVSKCPYCDFNSHVRETIDEAAWRDALLTDLRHEAEVTRGARVGSIFFGGGTPSLMSAGTVGAVIDEVAKLWAIDGDAEVTLEANPTSVEAARFAGFAAAGVNRVSLGLQALDDTALRFLGRPHDLATGLKALDVALANFGRVSFDLIYTRPGQSLDSWRAELTRALGFGTEHLSLYQLTIEAGTRFATLHARGELPMPHEDIAADLFAITQALMEAAGLPAYETSNHARPGAESRHNLAYWTYADHIGVGPGAHGRRGGVATVRHKKPENWIAAVEAGGQGIVETTPLDPATRAEEALMMGLRLREGIDRAIFEARTGLPLEAAIKSWARDELVGLGLIESDSQGIRTTAAGRPLLDAILAKLAA